MKDFNAELIKRLHNEVWSEGNIDVLNEICSKDFVDYISDDKIKSLDSYKNMVTEFRKAFPDWKERIQELIISGDKVVSRYSSSGTHLGVLFNTIQPTGKIVTLNEIAIFYIKEGKISEQRGIFDLYALYKQLGVV